MARVVSDWAETAGLGLSTEDETESQNVFKGLTFKPRLIAQVFILF